MSGTIIQAKNPSNNYQSLLVDSSGRLECSVNEIELTATQISLDVNDLETLTTAGNNTLSSIDNKVVLPSALDGGKLKVVDSAVVDVGNKIDAMRGSNSISDLATKLNAGLPAALSSSGNLKVSIEEGAATSDATAALQTAGNNTLSSIDNKLVLPSALDSGKLKVVDSAVVDNGNKIDAMRASDTLTTLKDTLEATLTNIETDQAALEVLHTATNSKIDDAVTALQLIDDIVKSEDAAHSGGDKGVQILSVRKDTATNLGGSDSDYQPLITDANGRLHCISKENLTYSSETSIISGQSVSGSGTHTTSSITNDPNIKEYLLEHNFSGSDVSYEIEESIDNSNFFNALGVQFNAVGSPTTANQGLLNAEIKSPFFRIKFTNGSGSSRDVNLSFVSINR